MTDYLSRGPGLQSWLSSTDHKRIGVMYLVSILSAFLLGGIFAILMRTEMLTPARTIVDVEAYNQFFTLHGAIMVFLFAIPGIPAALGNFVLPLMLGAKNVAFPKLNRTCFHLWILGAFLSLLAIVFGGVDAGWTFYTPYSISTETNVILAAIGVAILGFSSVFTGLNFIVTIHRLRRPGLTWFKMPLFAWSLYATGIIQLLAMPVLAATLLLLTLERATGLSVFDPASGGDPVFFQHLFWFSAHPAVFIMVLPGMGIVSELMSTFSRKHIFGYKPIAYSSVAIALLSFLAWGHHMTTSGQSDVASTIFSAFAFIVAVPFAIKVFSWIATMHKGSIRLDTPMIYALAFIILIGVGGLSGLFLMALATSIHLHDTYFAVAHFHYVIVGGMVVAFIGGLHYWWPKMFGRRYSENWGRFAASLIFIGLNMTFFTQFIMGSKGMPRRYYNYADEFTGYHVVSSIGTYLLAVGFIVVAAYLIHSLTKGRPAPANPWGGNSLEWHTSSPPPPENFDGEIPPARDPYDYDDLAWDGRNEEYVVEEHVAKSGAVT